MAMNVTQVLLADYANISREGKLNVLGIFSRINARGFPVVHSQMQVIILWEASRTESGKTKKIEVQLIDADGNRVLSMAGEFTLPEGKPGKMISGHHILSLVGLRFEKPGQYAFHVIINEEEKGKASFEVIQIPGKAEDKK